MYKMNTYSQKNIKKFKIKVIALPNPTELIGQHIIPIDIALSQAGNTTDTGLVTKSHSMPV